MFIFVSPCRELQFLADQERISPAAIKKTTLDKVLQQPGVAVGGDAGGNGRSGLNLFNSRTSGIKKKNWEQRDAERQTCCRFTSKHADSQRVSNPRPTVGLNSGLRTALKSPTNQFLVLFIHTRARNTYISHRHRSILHSWRLLLWLYMNTSPVRETRRIKGATQLSYSLKPPSCSTLSSDFYFWHKVNKDWTHFDHPMICQGFCPL